MTERFDRLLAQGRSRLTGTVDDPAAEAALLAAAVLGVNRATLLAWPEREAGDDAVRRYLALVERRAAGEPVAYLLGEREFWSLPLAVSPDTLIPRADTETLVECALAVLPADTTLAVADLGTGSGAVALAIASERPGAYVLATDSSFAALRVAATNARRLGLANVGFTCGRWCRPLGLRRFAVIVSNPPYIAGDDPHLPSLAHEPRSALVAADGGLADLSAICEDAGANLLDGGRLLLEHGADQGEAVRGLLMTAGFESVNTWNDLAGNPRVSGGRWPGN